MTTVITRYFDSTKQAMLVWQELIYRRSFSPAIMDMYDHAEGLTEALVAQKVEEKTAKEYKKRIAKGGAVILVRAGNKPLAVAKTARVVMGGMGAVDMGDLVEQVVVREDKRWRLSVMRGAPLMLSRARDPYATNHHMANWPIPLISRRKPFKGTIVPPHGRMANWPLKLLWDRKPYTESIIPRHGRMANFPLPLLSDRKPYTGSIVPKHGRMANFPIPLISKRKPYTGSAIPRHMRMANWPFPHLINGKIGTNSLMPGAPRMANFPIPLLSQRKPSDAFAFPRHARMANFPLPLISKRKPSDQFAFPRHARMADMILPLVIKHSEPKPNERKSGFSLSRMFGLPTLIRR